jgi:hypothetical protein
MTPASSANDMPDEIWVNKNSEEKSLNGGRCFRTAHDFDCSPRNTIKYIRADRAPSEQQGERVTVDEIFDLIYRNYNEKPCAETTKMILDFAVRANAAFDIFKKPIIVKDKE